jgi:predicted ATPase
MRVAPQTLDGDASGDDAVWHVALLGGLVLSDGSQRITRLPSRAVTMLLARLAMAPYRAHGREALIELLWPGVSPEVGRNRLRQALSTLKSLLEPPGREPHRQVLVADRQEVRVVDGALACDALQFEQSVNAGRVEAARALYRGELLPGFYDDWVDEQRSRLSALLESLPPQAAPAVRTAGTASAPPRTLEPEIRVQLPSYLTRMFGAEAMASRLRETVLAHRLVTLFGPGGSGKTRLAIEVAHTLRPHADWPTALASPHEPFDLIAFVSLAAYTRRTQALDAIVTALQIPHDGEDALRALGRALAGRRTLLLLDNLEQLLDDAAEGFGALLAVLPQLHVLATSRRAMELPGEVVVELQPLALPFPDAGTSALAANPSVALFVERARAVRADFHLSARNRDAVAELVRELEGMPLAIELAASRVRTLAPAAMLERLRRTGTPRLELLARSAVRGDSPARHASMQRTIAWSWQLLDAAQMQLLSALTVFAGSFDLQAATAVMPAGDFDVPLVLDTLVAHSLVHRRSDGDESRFGLYQPIREFALAQAAPADAAAWRARLRAWAVTWARGLPRTPSLPLLRTEMPNLLAALHSAVHDDAPADAIELLLALRRCLEDVNLPAEGLADGCAAAQRCTDPLLRSRARSLLSPLLFIAGQAPLALQLAEQGLAEEGLGRLQRARALHALARVRWRSRRQAGEVEPLLDEAEALLGDADDDEQRASLLALRAFVANSAHRDHRLGETLHARALALWQRSGNRHAIASGRYNLAVCAQNANRHADCLRQLEPVIASARELQDWRRLSQSMNVRGNACAGLRDWPQAIRDYQECIRVAWASMDAYDLAFGLWNLPRALLHRDQADTAVRLQAFSVAFWRSGFGELSEGDERYLKRFERLAGRLMPRAAFLAAWHEGEQMVLSQAVSLAVRGR